MTLPPPPPPTPVRPLSLWQRWRTSVLLGCVAMGVLVVYVIASSNDPDPVPSVRLELCDALRDPENNNLTGGDWERLTDWPESKIRRYVTDRCPEQLDRFP